MLAYHVTVSILCEKKFCKEAFTLAKFLVPSLHEIVDAFSIVKCASLSCYSVHFVAKKFCEDIEIGKVLGPIVA